MHGMKKHKLGILSSRLQVGNGLSAGKQEETDNTILFQSVTNYNGVAMNS